MKRVFLLIVVPALLVALGFAQTPAASSNTDQINIKGCLGGSDGNYTVVEDNTGQIFKITTSSVDLKPHLGHDVKLIGHKASGAVSSAAAENSLAVTGLNMISEHCAAAAAAAAAAAPTATVSTPSETTSTPSAVAAAPAATISTPAETGVAPAVAAASLAATVTTPAETAVTAAAAATTVSTPSETASTPAAAAAHPTRPPAGPRRLSATPAAATTTPAVTASSSSETVSTPAAAATTPAVTASSSSETVSTPAAATTTPTATAKGESLWLLISFVVLVIVIGTLAPFLSRWRKRKLLERTGDQNLSFTHEASSDQGKSDQPHKAA